MLRNLIRKNKNEPPNPGAVKKPIRKATVQPSASKVAQPKADAPCPSCGRELKYRAPCCKSKQAWWYCSCGYKVPVA